MDLLRCSLRQRRRDLTAGREVPRCGTHCCRGMESSACRSLSRTRERDKSAEVAVTHEPTAFWDLSSELLQHDGARAGSRTLNLGIKRRSTFLAWKRQDAPWRASRVRRSDALVPQSVLARHSLPCVSCQAGCRTRRRLSRPRARVNSITWLSALPLLPLAWNGCKRPLALRRKSVASIKEWARTMPCFASVRLRTWRS